MPRKSIAWGVKSRKGRRSVYQTGKSNLKPDRKRSAKPPGRRVSAKGNVYTERRKNRSDKPGKKV